MAEFVAWQRPAVYALATSPRTTDRLQAALTITLEDDAGAVPASASFLLAGHALLLTQAEVSRLGEGWDG